MQSIMRLGLAVVVALAFGAVTASGSLAEEFVASKTGKLKGKALNTQEFKTGTGATVDCTSVELSGAITRLSGREQAVSMTSGNCTVSGIGTATVSADNVTAFLPPGFSGEKPVLIKAHALGVECEIEVNDAGELGTASGEIEYVNKSGKIEVRSSLTKVVSEILKSNSTSLCGTAGEKSSTGKKAGNIEVELEGGGAIEVK